MATGGSSDGAAAGSEAVAAGSESAAGGSCGAAGEGDPGEKGEPTPAGVTDAD
jgi:hypothetical protein